MLKREFLFLLLIAVAVLELLSWETASWPSSCVIQMTHEEQAARHYNEKDCPTFFSGSLILLGRADHVIESHDKSIVAGFTIILALSTIGLWLATFALQKTTKSLFEAGEKQIAVAKQAADAAMLSARAAVGVQLPIIRASIHDFVVNDTGESRGGAIVGDPASYGMQYAFPYDFVFRNIGKSTAYPSQYGLGWSLSHKLPEEPIYDAVYSCAPHQIIAEGGDWDAPIDTFRIELPEEIRKALRANQAVLRIFCFLKYSDFLETLHEVRFCWRLHREKNGRSNGLIPDDSAPAAYTSKT